MFLRKIYTKPSKFFDTVIFRDGINFVYAYRDKKEKNGTLNNLGKSTFLDLIDFCLGSDFKATHTPRLFDALEEGILKGITVYLEIEVENNSLLIVRGFDNPNNLTFYSANSETKTLKLDEAREYLFNFIFARSGYPGIMDSAWLRSLLPFYIKILRHRKAEYPDPFFYLDYKNVTVLLQFHLFILNISNTYFHDLQNLNQQNKKNISFEKENRSRLMTIYNLRKFEQAQSILNQKISELNELRSKLETFRFAKTQQINYEKANELSKKINELTLKNYLDQQKINSYLESVKETSTIRINDVEKIFNEAFELFGSTVKHTLEESIEFKKNLHISRKQFIDREIKTLKESIKQRNEQIDTLDQTRAEFYSILSTADSVKNYTDSRNVYDDKLKEIAALEEHINAVNHYTKEIIKLETDIDEIASSIIEFRSEVIPQEKQIFDLIDAIHKAIYVKPPLKHIFSFSTDLKTDSILRMKIMDSSGKQGKGINKSRSLIYDLAVLFYSIENKIKAPRFIIHDGIFDGFDKAKALETFDFLDKKIAEGFKFQYIVTLNDEGIYKTAGKNADALHHRILKEAILKLTPDIPLFKQNY